MLDILSRYRVISNILVFRFTTNNFDLSIFSSCENSKCKKKKKTFHTVSKL